LDRRGEVKTKAAKAEKKREKKSSVLFKREKKALFPTFTRENGGQRRKEKGETLSHEGERKGEGLSEY